MRLSVRTKPIEGESLESYILRVSHDNGYFKYKRLAGVVVYQAIINNDIDQRSESINRLNSVNIYQENNPKTSRKELFQFLAKLVGIEQQLLESLALHRSDVRFCSDYKAIQYEDQFIPRCFIRKKSIPVCVYCLKEKPFIRQIWHFIPYQQCHVHDVNLLTHCPRCKNLLDYRKSESFSHCSCGCNLLIGEMTPMTENIPCFITPSDNMPSSNLFFGCDLTQRMSLLLWYFMRFSAATINWNTLTQQHNISISQYFDHWPHSFEYELENKEELSGYILSRSPSQTAFKKVFGSVLTNAVVLSKYPYVIDPVINAVKKWMDRLIEKHPSSSQGNLGDLLLSIQEISSLFSVSIADVYQAVGKGKIRTPIRLKARQPIKIWQPLFPLRQFNQYIKSESIFNHAT